MARQVPWSRICAEGVAIVVSILLAFGIQAWWENRQERALETQYLERLALDSRLNVEMFEERAGFYQSVREHSVAALEAMEEPSELSETAVATLYLASRSVEPAFLDATFRELQSTGSLRLIRDVGLRTALVEYQVSITNFLEGFAGWDDRTAYRNTIRSLLGPEVQDAILLSCQPDTTAPLECDVALHPEDLEALRSYLLRHAETLRQPLLLWTAAQRNLIGSTRDAAESSRAMLRLIQEALTS